MVNNIFLSGLNKKVASLRDAGLGEGMLFSTELESLSGLLHLYEMPVQEDGCYFLPSLNP